MSEFFVVVIGQKSKKQKKNTQKKSLRPREAIPIG